MTAIVIPCPRCGAELIQSRNQLVCANGHWHPLPAAIYLRRAGTLLLPGLDEDPRGSEDSGD